MNKTITLENREYKLVDTMNHVELGNEGLVKHFESKELKPFTFFYERVNTKRESKVVLLNVVQTLNGEYRRF